MELKRDALATWVALLEANSVITEGLDQALQAASGLPLGWFEVLIFLDEDPEGRLRMQDLAGSVLLSKSGITRLVDRMELQGLVQRAACVSDRRVTYAEITPAGREALRAAVPVHSRALKDVFLEHLSDAELDQLRRLLRKVLDANGREERICTPVTAPASAAV